jgi:hypothetical protein
MRCGALNLLGLALRIDPLVPDHWDGPLGWSSGMAEWNGLACPVVRRALKLIELSGGSL